MSYYLIKIAITTALIVTISEIAKRSTLFGAVLASIPLISVLAMFWLYFETKDVSRVSTLATSVLLLILPSLALFITLPILLRHGMSFYPSIGISILATIVCYFLMVSILHYLGIRL
ncbi:MAG: Na+/melibiose symporter-like transporter [Desulforhopalus sp.]